MISISMLFLRSACNFTIISPISHYNLNNFVGHILLAFVLHANTLYVYRAYMFISLDYSFQMLYTYIWFKFSLAYLIIFKLLFVL